MSGSATWIDKLVGRDVKHSPGDPCADGMGDCVEVRDNASDFIDGEVSPGLTTRIRQHLVCVLTAIPGLPAWLRLSGLLARSRKRKSRTL